MRDGIGELCPDGPTDPLLRRALDSGERAWRRGSLLQARALLTLAWLRAEWRASRACALGVRQLLGHVALDRGEHDEAWRHHEAVLDGSAAIGLAVGAASALHNLGLVAAARGDEGAARQLIGQAIAQYEALGHDRGAESARANLAAWASTWGEGSDDHP